MVKLSSLEDKNGNGVDKFTGQLIACSSYGAHKPYLQSLELIAVKEDC